MKRTTLILGAGASAPYGYPLGTGLRDKLLELTSNIHGVMSDANIPIEEWQAVRALLLASQYDSVDDFIAKYPEHSRLTKLAVAYWINLAESPEMLFRHDNGDHWYKALVLKVLENDHALGGGALTIVTFNYDLSLEHYLFSILTARHRLSEDQALAVLARLQITHMHGHLGPLQGLHGNWRAYGPTNKLALAQAAGNILTCHETGGEEAATTARKLIAESERVYFLGFGYSKENLARLDLGKSLGAEARVGGSIFRCPDYAGTLSAHIDMRRFGTSDGRHAPPATTALLQLLTD